METTVAGCLVLKEATSEGGHGRDSRPGNVCDLAVLTPHHTADVSLLSVWHFTSNYTHTHTYIERYTLNKERNCDADTFLDHKTPNDGFGILFPY